MEMWLCMTIVSQAGEGHKAEKVKKRRDRGITGHAAKRSVRFGQKQAAVASALGLAGLAALHQDP